MDAAAPCLCGHRYDQHLGGSACAACDLCNTFRPSAAPKTERTLSADDFEAFVSAHTEQQYAELFRKRRAEVAIHWDRYRRFLAGEAVKDIAASTHYSMGNICFSIKVCRDFLNSQGIAVGKRCKVKDSPLRDERLRASITAMATTGAYSYREIAARFGCKPWVVQRIVGPYRQTGESPAGSRRVPHYTTWCKKRLHRMDAPNSWVTHCGKRMCRLCLNERYRAYWKRRRCREATVAAADSPTGTLQSAAPSH
jgi:hypothetical protein